MIKKAVPSSRIEVDTFQGLLVDYAKQKNARIILRGLGASDFEFEFQLAHMNRRLGADLPGGLETMFMMTGEEQFYVSSSLHENCNLWRFGDRPGPPHAETRLHEVFKQDQEGRVNHAHA